MSVPELYLIDGSSYIFRAYFAIGNLRTSSGFPTNAIYGFTAMMFKFLKDFKPSYVAMVFDAKGKSFRNDIYPDYKANRDKQPEDLALQITKIHEIVEAFSLPLIMEEGYEADDVIGTIAKANEKKGIKVTIITGDKDFYQLVSDKITLYDPMRSKKTEVQDVVARYGVSPDKITDLFALCGDKSDNIPGVRGIGEKTASKLISKFGSLENLYNNLDKVSARERKLLLAHKEEAFLSKKLVTIRTDVPVETDYRNFEYKGFDRKKLLKIFDELEFKNLKRELEPNSDKKKHDSFTTKTPKEANYRVVKDTSQIKQIIEQVQNVGYFSIDLETTSRNPMVAEIVGIAISVKPGSGYYIPLAHSKSDFFTQLEGSEVFTLLKGVLESARVGKVGQNMKYEYVVLWNHGIKLRGILFDTMLAAHLLDSSKISYRLEELARVYLSRTMTTYRDVTGRGKSKKNFSDVEIDVACDYACEDSDITLQLFEVLKKELEEKGLLKVYQKRVLPLIEVLAYMEINGVKIDEAILKELSESFHKQLEAISEEIYSVVGYEFNLNSPLQLREVLFNDLKLPVGKRTSTGGPSTDYEVLINLSKLHPVAEKILHYRILSKLVSTYIDSLPQLINSRTGRVHTSYNPVGTATGRISSSDPNLQNIPIKTNEGKKIRKAFVPEDGYVYLSADYSQIELRLLAHFSNDPKLVEAFLNDEDIHTKTASELFGVEEEDITAEMRRLAKTINFGIIYGISPYGLAKQLGTSVSLAKDYIERYFERYSGVASYIKDSLAQATEKGYSETIIGRRRFISELRSANRVQRGIGERAAINTPIQGSAADIINLAMINIHEMLKGSMSKMVLQIHDELIFEVYNDELEEIRTLVKEEMESVYPLRVPLKVDIKIGNNWAELE